MSGNRSHRPRTSTLPKYLVSPLPVCFVFTSRRRHTIFGCDWSSDVCSSDLYRGAAPAVTDVATGAVTMSFTSLAAALPLMQDGRLRAVAVTSRERMPQLPDVVPLARSEERRVGKEGRSRWSPYH